MRISFDVSQTGRRKAGCGFFADAMARALLQVAPQHDYRFHPSFGDFYFDPLMPVANPFGHGSRYGRRHVTRGAAAAFWNDPALEEHLGAPQVVHSNNYWCPTQLQQSRLIYTCYDLGFAIEPSWTTEANRTGCFEGVFRASVAADWIVAISSASREHYLQVFPHFPAERVRVIHPCSRFEASREGRQPRLAADLSGGFWLSVGTIEPRKNQRMLLRAYSGYLAAGGNPMPLVLAGGDGWLMEGFAAEIRSLGLADRVVLTGYVRDEELAWLYRNCFASLYPSLYEGFGLPVLEGMQLGAPTVCASNSSLPEVAGDAALLVDAGDTAAWTQAMLRLAGDSALRGRLSQAAGARASAFDARKSALALAHLYEEAVAAPKRVPAALAA